MISLPLGVQQGCLYCCGCIEGQGARQVAVLKTAIHPLVFCTLWGLYTRVFVVESHSHTSCGLGMRLNYISYLHTCTSVQFCILTVSTSKERQKVCSCNFFLFQILNELWFLHLMRHDLDSPSSCMLICIHSSFVHWSPSWIVFLCFSQSVVLLSLLPRPIRIGLGYKARYCCDIPHLAMCICLVHQADTGVTVVHTGPWVWVGATCGLSVWGQKPPTAQLLHWEPGIILSVYRTDCW